MRLKEFSDFELTSKDYDRMLNWLSDEFEGDSSKQLNNLVKSWKSGVRHMSSYSNIFKELDADLSKVLGQGLSYGER
jgi:hypothetical protein